MWLTPLSDHAIGNSLFFDTMYRMRYGLLLTIGMAPTLILGMIHSDAWAVKSCIWLYEVDRCHPFYGETISAYSSLVYGILMWLICVSLLLISTMAAIGLTFRWHNSVMAAAATFIVTIFWLGLILLFSSGARWRNGALARELDDAVQDAFVECFRDGGALGRADPDKPGRFRTFLFAVVRNVARRREERYVQHARRHADETVDADAREARDERASRAFDRAWATTLLRAAAELQESRASSAGPDAVRRVELLRLRFHDGRPIRDIAALWGEEPTRVHHEYARARKEFQRALRDVLAEHLGNHSDSTDDLDRECRALLESLG
jgi:RNA polymerase sigma factor (sigma-70 family)